MTFEPNYFFGILLLPYIHMFFKYRVLTSIRDLFRFTSHINILGLSSFELLIPTLTFNPNN